MIQLYAILDYDKKMNNLQLPQKDMEKEIAQLEYFIKSDIDARELKRAIAVRMALSGNIYQEISKILGVSKFFIGYWKKQFETKKPHVDMVKEGEEEEEEKQGKEHM